MVTPTVPLAAAPSIEGDRATAFMDQQVTRAVDADQFTETACLSVTDRRVDGKWKIADVEAG